MVQLLEYFDFWDRFFFFKKNPSYKIALSRREGVGRHPNVIFWLTFFQSYMLHLLLNCWTESNQIWFVASLT